MEMRVTGLNAAVSAAASFQLASQIQRIRIPALWHHGLTGKGVTVVVFDQGVDATHPFLKPAIAGGRNFVPGESPDWWAQPEPHGTAVAGVIRQVAPGARILVCRVLDAAGNGSFEAVAQALDWARSQAGPGDILIGNMSLGGDREPGGDVHAAVQRFTKWFLLAAAAGNDGHELLDISTVNWPARWYEPLAVAATMELVRGGPGYPAVYSSAGPEVDVTAPGTFMVTAAPGGGWAAYSGTSFACPVVAGFAALLAEDYKRKLGGWPGEPDLVTLVKTRTVDIGPAGRDVLSGVGEINAVPEAVHRQVKLQAGSEFMYVDGRPRLLDVPARIEPPGRFVAPFRYMAEGLGAAVGWDAISQTGSADLDVVPEAEWPGKTEG